MAKLTEQQTKERGRLNALLNLLHEVKASCNCETYNSQIEEVTKQLQNIGTGKEDEVIEEILEEVGADEQGTADVEDITEQPTEKPKRRTKKA